MKIATDDKESTNGRPDNAESVSKLFSNNLISVVMTGPESLQLGLNKALNQMSRTTASHRWE